jgi:4-amino-4-deoxy-L-arabinose transferase-like glycosyltransferase
MESPSTSESPQPLVRTKFLSRTTALCTIFAAWFLIYVPSLAQPGLLDDADSIHAEASREMLLNHNWVTLYINGIRYLEKAPLMYWAVALSYKLFGVGDWQTRLPLALAVLALTGGVFIFGRRYLGEEAGLYASLILITAPGIFIYTRFLIPDVIVALWLTLGLYLFRLAYEQDHPSRWVCWGIAITIALNVLTKSLIGIVFPAMIIFVFLLLAGNFKKLLKMHPWSSALAFLVVAAPWHILAAIRSPEQSSGPEKGFLWFYFVNEQFLRYLNKRIPRDYDKVPLLLFWALLFVWLIPWCIYLLPALKNIPGQVRDWRDRLDSRSRANLFFGIWAAVIMLFFSFSTRQEYYSLPALPPLALLIGGWLQDERSSTVASAPRKAGQTASAILFGIGIFTFAGAMAMLAFTHPFPPGTDIGTVLTPHPGQYKLSLGHMQDLTFDALGLFRGPLLLVGLALLVGTGLNWLLRRRGAAIAANLAIAAMMVVVLFCVHRGYVIFSPELTSKTMALQIKNNHLQPDDKIIINGKFELGSTLNYYTGAELYVLNGRDGNLWFGSFFPGAPDIFLDDQSFARLWNGPNRVFLFTEDYVQDQALRDLNHNTVFVFAHQGGKTIFTNRAGHH